METRFKMLTKSKPEDAARLWKQAQNDADLRYRLYEYLAQRKVESEPPTKPVEPATSPQVAAKANAE
jgi:pyruvate-ferredoxin/flavodoxin oxidoreductase